LFILIRNGSLAVEAVDAPVVDLLIWVVVEDADEAVVLFALPGHGVEEAGRVADRVGAAPLSHAPQTVQRVALRPALHVFAPAGVEAEELVVVVVPKLIIFLKNTF